ncbi:MAG: hypothetical protein R3F29_06955 [Planctomycetota bacterium]
MRSSLSLSLLAIAWCGAGVATQQPCDPAPVPSGAMPGVDRSDSMLGQWMHAVAWDPDGAGPMPELLAVCGTFRTAGSALANGLATYDPLTASFRDLPSYSTPDRMFAGPAGQLLYTYVDIWAGVYPLMQWNGVSWTSVGVFDGPVSDLVWLPNGDLLVTGSFATADLVSCTGLARRTSNGWQSSGSSGSRITFQIPGWPSFLQRPRLDLRRTVDGQRRPRSRRQLQLDRRRRDPRHRPLGRPAVARDGRRSQRRLGTQRRAVERQPHRNGPFRSRTVGALGRHQLAAIAVPYAHRARTGRNAER